MTNGGGMREADKASDLSEKLGIPVRPEQILLAHTPYKQYVDQYRKDRVLIMGHDGCAQLAKEYGFTGACSVQSLIDEDPRLSPYVPGTSKRSDDAAPPSNESADFKAVFIFHDPMNWAVEMQVLSDVLLGRKKPGAPLGSGSRQQIPLYSSNADLVYSSPYECPRYTQGAFITGFRSIFEAYIGSKEPRLVISYTGKPFAIQYRSAEQMLFHAAAFNGDSSIAPDSLPSPTGQGWQFFGVGDNPAADIRGANLAGPNWKSILVQSGVYKGGDVQPQETCEGDRADHVCAGVVEAIDYILGSSHDVI
jgi:HAD superfamily hydrolase (TIGR01456 family)